MLKSRGGNIYAQSIFIADNNIQVRGSALSNSGVALSQPLTVGGPAHHYSPGTLEYGKAVLDLAYLADSLVELRETQRPRPGTGKEAGAEAAAGPFGP